jgi:hypothetical protein
MNRLPSMSRWRCAAAAMGLSMALAGCTSSSSSSVSAVPAAAPSVGSAAAQETTYLGVLVHTDLRLGAAAGWRLRNARLPGSVPVDVSKVKAQATALAGKVVLVTAHSAAPSGGRAVLVADRVALYAPAN